MDSENESEVTNDVIHNLNHEEININRKRKLSENDSLHADIIKKPYIFKRIKQNLQNISLNCDTDDDEEWIDENLNQTINTTTKILRPRSKIILSLNSSESESDEDDESDSSSFVSIKEVQEENLHSSKEIVE